MILFSEYFFFLFFFSCYPFVLLMLKECKVCSIKGSNKNVLNTSKVENLYLIYATEFYTLHVL